MRSIDGYGMLFPCGFLPRLNTSSHQGEYMLMLLVYRNLGAWIRTVLPSRNPGLWTIRSVHPFHRSDDLDRNSRQGDLASKYSYVSLTEADTYQNRHFRRMLIDCIFSWENSCAHGSDWPIGHRLHSAKRVNIASKLFIGGSPSKATINLYRWS